MLFDVFGSVRFNFFSALGVDVTSGTSRGYRFSKTGALLAGVVGKVDVAAAVGVVGVVCPSVVSSVGMPSYVQLVLFFSLNS